MQFTKQETATVLAALRMWQSKVRPLVWEAHYNPATSMALRDVPSELRGHFEEEQPLFEEEIDDLCERINLHDDTPTLEEEETYSGEEIEQPLDPERFITGRVGVGMWVGRGTKAEKFYPSKGSEG